MKKGKNDKFNSASPPKLTSLDGAPKSVIGDLDLNLKLKEPRKSIFPERVIGDLDLNLNSEPKSLKPSDLSRNKKRPGEPN